MKLLVEALQERGWDVFLGVTEIIQGGRKYCRGYAEKAGKVTSIILLEYTDGSADIYSEGFPLN